MFPPDPRLSEHEIAKMFDIEMKNLSNELRELTGRAFICPYKSGNKKLYIITEFGIAEVEKVKEKEKSVEFGTSGVRVRFASREKTNE